MATLLSDALNPHFVGGTSKIIAPRHGGLGIGRIGKMTGILNSGAILLDLDFAIEIRADAFEFRDHAFNLRDFLSLLVDLKLFQANECIA